MQFVLSTDAAQNNNNCYTFCVDELVFWVNIPALSVTQRRLNELA